jgi:hypothetical protein
MEILHTWMKKPVSCRFRRKPQRNLAFDVTSIRTGHVHDNEYPYKPRK